MQFLTSIIHSSSTYPKTMNTSDAKSLLALESKTTWLCFPEISSIFVMAFQNTLFLNILL